MNKLTSRERILRAINYEEVDHIPCSFMSFSALRNRLDDDIYQLSKAELEMGLDSMLFVPYLPRCARPDHPDLRGLPIEFHEDVEIREWREEVSGGYDILYKEYHTPAGILRTRVRLSADWMHGNHIPFIDDYQVPRQLEPLIKGSEDLDALQFLLQPPAEKIKDYYDREISKAKAFVDEFGSLLIGGWGVGMDMANWLCGMENLMVAAMTRTEFVEDLLEIIHEWNLARMKMVLSGGVDLFIKRAWYEGSDFIVPKFYEDIVLPRLKEEVDLAHEFGACFGYICSSGLKPMLSFFEASGMDVLIGVDPVQGTQTDLPKLKETFDGKIALWGGVSGAVTVEMGSEQEIRSAVREAVEILGPKGFILSPVDNITVDEPQTWKNVDKFIDEWKKRR
jgi:uroporphyrinogen-III decarboxylase